MKEQYKVNEMWTKKDPLFGEIIDKNNSRHGTYSEALYNVRWNILFFNNDFNRPTYKWNIGIWGWN